MADDTNDVPQEHKGKPIADIPVGDLDAECLHCAIGVLIRRRAYRLGERVSLHDVVHDLAHAIADIAEGRLNFGSEAGDVVLSHIAATIEKQFGIEVEVNSENQMIDTRDKPARSVH